MAFPRVTVSVRRLAPSSGRYRFAIRYRPCIRDRLQRTARFPG